MEISERQYELVQRVCLANLRDHEDHAEDVVQAVFEKYLKNKPGEIKNPSHWLTKVARNECAQFYRDREKRTEIYAAELLPIVDEDGTEKDRFEHAIESKALEDARNVRWLDYGPPSGYLEALGRLSPIRRAAWVLCRDHRFLSEADLKSLRLGRNVLRARKKWPTGAPDAEAARILSLKEKTLSSHLTRIRKLLLEELSSEWWFWRPTAVVPRSPRVASVKQVPETPPIAPVRVVHVGKHDPARPAPPDAAPYDPGSRPLSDRKHREALRRISFVLAFKKCLSCGSAGVLRSYIPHTVGWTYYCWVCSAKDRQCLDSNDVGQDFVRTPSEDPYKKAAIPFPRTIEEWTVHWTAFEKARQEQLDAEEAARRQREEKKEIEEKAKQERQAAKRQLREQKQAAQEKAKREREAAKRKRAEQKEIEEKAKRDRQAARKQLKEQKQAAKDQAKREREAAKKQRQEQKLSEKARVVTSRHKLL